MDPARKRRLFEAVVAPNPGEFRGGTGDALVFSPSGKLLATAGEQAVRL